MNDRAISLLEQYDIEVLRTRKGRGAFICDTKQGSITLKEYSGNPEKLKLQQQILQRIKEIGLVRTEELLPNKEGLLYVKDNDGACYILKTCFEGSECNIYDGRECIEVIQMLAKLHHCMEGTVEEPAAQLVPYSPLREYEKHNRELVRVWSYLKKKGQKQIFEIRLLGVMEYFVKQARQVTESWQVLEQVPAAAPREGGVPERIPMKRIVAPAVFSHGDFQYHNILKTQEGWCVVNFEKLQLDNPVRDVYLFMRKVLEKNHWDIGLGRDMLAAYEAIRSLDEYARKDLYYRFAYPEKFWKIANFYYNSGKAWIPEKNLEKLKKVISQEKEKQAFLQEVFGENLTTE